MATKFNWKGEHGTTLIAKIKEYKVTEKSIEGAARKLSSESKRLFGQYFKPTALSGTYHAVNARRKDTDRPVFSTGRFVTMDELIEMTRFVRKYGITITQ